MSKNKFSGKEKAKHVMLISLDGLYEEDFQFISSLPNFKALLENGAFSREVKSIYPTLTYVIHTSIVTGNYPEKHGVIHNHQLQPGIPEDNQRWYWYRDEIKCDTIYDAVIDKGMITTSLFWPVTGRARIKYNIPEILALEGENQSLKVLKAGSPLFLLKSELKYGNIRSGAEQPFLDMFATKIAVDNIINKRPNLMMIHFVALDSMRHSFGVKSKEAYDSIRLYDKFIGEIIDATKKASIYDDTIFVITSDHGLIDINYRVYLNNLFYREGLIEIDENNKLNYKAYCQSTGLGAFVHIKDNNIQIREKVLEILNKAKDEGEYGIDKIYINDDLNRLKADSSYEIAIEAKDGYIFKDDITENDIVEQSSFGYKYATHGYSPEKEGYKNIVIIYGDKIKENYDIGAIDMVDIAPSIAEILGIDDFNCDGKIIKGIYKD